MTEDLIFFAIFIGVFLVVLSLVFAFGGRLGGGRRKRIDALRDRVAAQDKRTEQEQVSLVRDDREASGLERVLARLLPRPEELRLRLQRAGLVMSVGRYATITAGAVAIAVGLLKLVLGLPLLLALLSGVAVGIMGPHLWVKVRISRRELRFLQLFPEAIDLMVRGLKSGLPIGETIVNVGHEMPDPIGIEFRTMADAVRLGATIEEALWDAAARITIPEFKFFAISLSVQRQTGGNLGETLANLSDILRKRLTMKLKVKAMSAEARASAYIIGSLPFVMVGILMLMSPDYVMKLFTDPRGQVMIGIGLTMIAMGGGVMYKMVRFEI